MRLYRRLLLVATLLAVLVIGLGAYVRLSDAGLGCPDWPGCYGHLIGVPEAAPDRPVDAPKAWKEMIHRYAAGSLGLLILSLGLLAWRRPMRQQQSPLLPTLLLGVVGLQAALGMWTVTLLLKPMIVTLHLLGGMLTLSLLLVQNFHRADRPSAAVKPAWRLLAAMALAAVIGQIALGGWVSTNYAALACGEFPLCQGQLVPAGMDFGHAFTLYRELGMQADGQLLSGEALTAIHWTHRLGALLVTLLVGSLALALRRTSEPAWKRLGNGLLGMLTIQLGLGIANVLFALPLPLAVAHNLGAAGLLSMTLATNLRLQRAMKIAQKSRSTAALTMQNG